MTHVYKLSVTLTGLSRTFWVTPLPECPYGGGQVGQHCNMSRAEMPLHHFAQSLAQGHERSLSTVSDSMKMMIV